jgi:hypothetical protein
MSRSNASIRRRAAGQCSDFTVNARVALDQERALVGQAAASGTSFPDDQQGHSNRGDEQP